MKISRFALVVYALVLLSACIGPPFTIDGAGAELEPDAHVEDLDAHVASVDAGAELGPDAHVEDLDAHVASVDAGAELEPDAHVEDLDAHVASVDAGAELEPDAHVEDLDAGDAIDPIDAPAVDDDAGDCSPYLGECGGKTYVGVTCCQAGSTCTYVSASFSQCR